MTATRHLLPQTCRAVAALLALLLAPAALAQAPGWVGYGESETGTYFFDPASIQGQGDRKRVWRLFELKDKRTDGVQSGKALIEFDCKESSYRYLRTLYYAGSQGQGRVIGGAQAQAAEPVSPGSMIGALAQRVCRPERP